ncbi:hypothetical protein PRJBM_00929 [Bartonella henselae]|nr:hypothetical protein BhenCHDE101_04885 [Bartonella henselae]ETS08079.1 hypothetical protein Q654_00946 [Bartonella henselae JK 50]ETS08627.1 hypothetical protein Q655_00899 [Bartonella henselae JK 51]OLL41537.1 hypothetical protein AT237_05320 [Bartonella henselae]OLL43243.1 hypothetical protein AT242_03005 [Bartonella henselae]
MKTDLYLYNPHIMPQLDCLSILELTQTDIRNISLQFRIQKLEQLIKLLLFLISVLKIMLP